jgi:hypothetical protein
MKHKFEIHRGFLDTIVMDIERERTVWEFGIATEKPGQQYNRGDGQGDAERDRDKHKRSARRPIQQMTIHAMLDHFC